jgi:predicted ATPase
LGQTYFFIGEFPEAREHLEQTIALHEPKGHKAHVLMHSDPGVGARSYAALTLWILGYPAQALERSREALDLALELSHPFSLAQARQHAAFVHLFRGEVRPARDQAEALIGLSSEQGFPFYVGVGVFLRGWVQATEGQLEEGIAHMRAVVDAKRTAFLQVGIPTLIALLAEVYGKAGQPQEGIGLIREVMDAVNKAGARVHESNLHWQRGELLLAVSEDNQAKAENCFRQAIDVARRQSAKSAELRAATSLSRLWQKQGKKEEARQLLAEIYGWFTEGFDTRDLKEAKALLEEFER